MAKPKRLLLDNPQFAKQCVWRDMGSQCQEDGHLSTGTLGEGPWYCRRHFARKMGWPHYEVSVTDDPQTAIDKRVTGLVPRLEGETDNGWSMRCRAWVTDRMRRGRIFSDTPMREPGEDTVDA